METRANYVLIGAFVLAGFVAIIAFFLWFAQIELKRQFAYYDVRFSAVSGLAQASEVRYAGLPVGQVVDVRLAPDMDGTILVRLEIAAETPVRTDSIATIETLGVTGVSYVGISAGDPAAALLRAGDAVPEITAGRSVLQVLSQDAPEITAQILDLLARGGELFSPENSAKVQRILQNLEQSSENLVVALDEFSVLTTTVAAASTDIAGFTIELEPLITRAGETLGRVDAALADVSALAQRAQTTLDRADGAMASGAGALEAAEGLMRGEVPELLAELQATAEALRTEIAAVSGEAQGAIGSFGAAGTQANARLEELGATIAAADRAVERFAAMVGAVEAAATGFDVLVEGDGRALVAETRALVARADPAVAALVRLGEADLPAMLAEVREAAATISRVAETAGADFGAAAGAVARLEPAAAETLGTAGETFARASRTLGAIEEALATAQRTLAAAEGAFAGAEQVFGAEAPAIAADLRAAVARIDAAVAQIAADLPAVTADLRAAAGQANAAFGDLARIVATAEPPVADFTTRGLSEFTEAAREARTLLATLDRLIGLIERDPARFLIERPLPEFRP